MSSIAVNCSHVVFYFKFNHLYFLVQTVWQCFVTLINKRSNYGSPLLSGQLLQCVIDSHYSHSVKRWTIQRLFKPLIFYHKISKWQRKGKFEKLDTKQAELEYNLVLGKTKVTNWRILKSDSMQNTVDLWGCGWWIQLSHNAMQKGNSGAAHSWKKTLWVVVKQLQKNLWKQPLKTVLNL